MLSFLRYGVILSFLFAVVSLTFLVLRAFSFGTRAQYALPRGDARKGVLYALGKGMMPWEKESAGKHLPVYFAGVAYHAGIFAALVYLLSLVFSFELPAALFFLLRVFFVVGFLTGLGLFLRRVFLPAMRRLSCPDDFGSNAIVSLFLLLAAVNSYLGYRGSVGAGFLSKMFFVVAIVMFVSVPLGKIRHCFFFFCTRVLLGRFYGKRGVWPAEIPRGRES